VSHASHASHASRRWPLAAALLGVVLAAGCGDAPRPDDPFREVAGGRPERGLALIGHYQCGSCHVVPGGLAPVRPVGPSLAGFGRRSYIAGQVPNLPVNLQRWLQSPASLLPQATMPDLGVSAEDARDLAAYLMSLE